MDLAVQEGKSTALAEADFLNQIKGEFEGSVEVRRELIRIPRLKLNNALSDAVKGGLGKPGDFSCVVSGVSFGPSVTFVPLIVTESAALLDKETSTLICSSRDMVTNKNGQKCARCPHGQYWNDWSNGKIPECKTSIDMIVLVKSPELPGGQEVMQISFRKTSHTAGRKLLNLIVRDPRGVLFGSAYTIHGKEETNAKRKQTYYAIDSLKIERTPLSMEMLQEVLPYARKMKEIKDAGRIAEDEDLSDDVEPTEAVDETPF